MFFEVRLEFLSGFIAPEDQLRQWEMTRERDKVDALRFGCVFDRRTKGKK